MIGEGNFLSLLSDGRLSRQEEVRGADLAWVRRLTNGLDSPGRLGDVSRGRLRVLTPVSVVTLRRRLAVRLAAEASDAPAKTFSRFLARKGVPHFGLVLGPAAVAGSESRTYPDVAAMSSGLALSET